MGEASVVLEKPSNNTVEAHFTHFGGERRVTVLILENG